MCDVSCEHGVCVREMGTGCVMWAARDDESGYGDEQCAGGVSNVRGTLAPASIVQSAGDAQRREWSMCRVRDRVRVTHSVESGASVLRSDG